MLINRFKYISLALAVLIASASIAYADDNDHIKLLGDVNGDKSVNISDAISVISHIKGNTPAGFNVTASDVNVDETVNISDFIGIINLIKNKGVAGGSASSLIFTESSMSKTYGQDAFFNDVYRAGSTDDITFVSSNANVISVNATTGEMTVVGPGTATITATLPAFGSFSEAVASVTVTVAAANTSAINVNDDITFDAISYSYTGADVEPVVTVMLNGKDVTDQFDVTYEDNTNAGTAKVILMPKSTGGFAGSAPIEKEFTIEKANPTVSTAPATVSGDLSYTGSSQALATAGSVSNGTVMYYVNTSGTAPTSTSVEGWTSTIPTGEDAGTYHVWYYVKGDTNYNDSDIQSLGSKTISKAAATTDPVTTMNTGVTAKKNGDDNQTYTGGDITLVNAGESNAGTLKYKVTTTNEQPAKNSGGWSTDLPTAEDAGTYFVWYYAEGNDNYEETAVSATPIEVTIDKANPTVSTAPATVSGDLSYTGSSQALATAGSVSNGTVMYYVNTSGTAPTSTSVEGWTSTIPTGEDAGTYHVWYYVKGDTNYNDSDIQSLGSKTISKAAATTDPVTTMNTEVTAKKNGDDNQTYTGGDITLVNAGESNAGTLKYKVTTTNEPPAKTDGGWSTDLPTAEDAGTYFVWYYAEGNDNYEETAVSATPIEVTIDKAAITPTVSLSGWTYGSPNDPAVSGNTGNGTVTYYYKTGESEWTTTKPTDAGTHKVKASVAATSNYLAAETDAVEFIISQKALTITAKSQTITYGSAITSTINDVTTEGLVDGDALNNITLSKTKTDYSATAYANDITASSAVIMRSETDVTANYNITYTPGNLTINKAAASVTAAPTGNMGLTYNGSAQQLINATSATCSGGTLVYCKTSDGTYGAASDITETNAGTYSYYYKVQGDANHSDTDPVEVTNVSIAPKAVTISGITASNKTYDGTTMATLDCSSATFSGIVSGDNLTVTATGTFADANAGTGKTVTISDLTLGGSSVGNYTLAENGNQGSTTADISKAAATVTAPAFSALTYTGSAQNLVSAGSSEHGSFTYSTTQEGTYTNVIPQGTDAGDYTVWYKFTGDGNHNDVAATQVTGVSIQKANCTVSLSTTSLTIAPGSNSTFTVTRPGDGVITATSSNTSIANTSVSGTTVTVNKVATGTATITVTVAAGTNHNAYTASDKVVTVTSTAAPVLGDAYYSDGTWGNNAHAAGATVIGVVAWLGSDSDLKCGKSHGLVMALTDANSSVAWGGRGTDETYLNNCSSIANCQTYNKNGLTNTTNLGSSHGAANSAANYTPAAPTSNGATKWFLPSAAQWIAVLGSNGLGGYTGTFVWGNYATSSTGVITNINNFLTASGVGGTGLTNGAPYWSSSESDAHSAVCVYFLSSNGVYVRGSYKSYTYRVRAFLAF